MNMNMNKNKNHPFRLGKLGIEAKSHHIFIRNFFQNFIAFCRRKIFLFAVLQFKTVEVFTLKNSIKIQTCPTTSISVFGHMPLFLEQTIEMQYNCRSQRRSGTCTKPPRSNKYSSHTASWLRRPKMCASPHPYSAPSTSALAPSPFWNLWQVLTLLHALATAANSTEARSP